MYIPPKAEKDKKPRGAPSPAGRSSGGERLHRGSGEGKATLGAVVPRRVLCPVY